MKKLVLFLRLVAVSILLLTGCESSHTSAPSVLSSTTKTIQIDKSASTPNMGGIGMVATSNNLASQVGYDILKQGGNAVDAAVAVAFAEAVTYPIAGNLGGGGFMIISMADGRSAAIDYREVAPNKSTQDMYLDSQGNLIPQASTVGYLAVGVPGTVAGMAMAQEKFGVLTWQAVIEPARKLAVEGFPVSWTFVNDLRGLQQKLQSFPESKRIYLKDGNIYQAGEIFKQPELADTLTRIQKDGWREFYEGKTAQLIASDMKQNGGLITMDDLKNYHAIEREPIHGTYRGYDVITMPPPSSGGAVLIEMLNMLEQYDLAAMEPASAEKYHLLVEVMKRAYADRSEFFGDPDFVNVPITGLTSKPYALKLAQSIDMNLSTPSSQIKHGNPAPYESTQTTHFSIIDAAGNAVSNTYTINVAFGSGITVPGAGFLLNNEMDDFTSKVGASNVFGLIQGKANAIAPGKRPLSSMTPTIVLKDGKVAFVLGSPGGPKIINSVLQVIINVIDHGMTLEQAIAAPRIHHQWLPDSILFEHNGLTWEVREYLDAKGHTFKQSFTIGDVQAVGVDLSTGKRYGVSDPRNPDGKAIGD